MSTALGALLVIGQVSVERNHMRRLSLRAMQVIGAVAVERFCSRHQISDPAIDSFLAHLWSLASAESLPAWEQAGSSLEITGLGDPLPKRIVGQLSPEQAHRLLRLCDSACEISMSQMYTLYDSERALRFLCEAIHLSGSDLKPLLDADVFLEHLGGSGGWGAPVPPGLIEKWKECAQRSRCTEPGDGVSAANRTPPAPGL